MADYIYLLGTRLTRAQQAALETVREVARTHNLTVFLVGGAVRDLTSGAPVRDLDVAVQGDALKLRKELEDKGATTLGSSALMHTLHLSFPGGVRLSVEATLSVTFPKPGKPVTTPATILDDLRRRDFTANAMAISLNEGSFGLLMDPLNGVADIENRELRLVSNYGFIEDPARMLRGIRLAARAGWQFEEKTRQRYETGKAEDYIVAMNAESRASEIEDIFHEEEPLRVLRRLEEEDWSKSLFPALKSSNANGSELERLRDLVDQLQIMGIYPDPSAANFPLLTAKMPPKDVAELKNSFARPGFVKQIDSLDADTKEFAARFTAKNVTAPSDTWKLLLSSLPEQVLWLAFSSKSSSVQARFKAFFEEWPNARQRIPYGIMQEMRITQDLPGYGDLIESLFFGLMDTKLETPEAIREFLTPFSPPAPPPPPNVRRRPAKRESKSSKSKAKGKVVAPVTEDAVVTEVTEVEAVAVPVAEEKPAKVAPPKKIATKPEAPGKKSVEPVKAKPATKEAPAKIPPAKPVAPAVKAKAPASVAKKAVKAPAKAAKKAVPAKAGSKKGSVVKAVAKKAPAKIASAKKTAPAKKAAPTKKPAKTPVKKTVAKKTVAKKAVKTPVKKQTSKAALKKPAKKSRR